MSLRLCLVIAPRLVIARDEAIHRPWCNSLDCHGAARLAMTEGGSLHPALSLRGTKQSINGRAWALRARAGQLHASASPGPYHFTRLMSL
jgi:hypothetical protein